MFEFITELYKRNKWNFGAMVVGLAFLGGLSKNIFVLYAFVSIAVLCCWAGYKKEFDFAKEIILFPFTIIKFLVKGFKDK